VREFAAREGLNAVRLYRWRARFRAARPKTPAFIEIKAPPARTIEVVLRSGHVVRVPVGFDGETLRRLAAVLEEQSSQC
jgi:hypothetical protein